MKYIKKYNEELSPDTYRSAGNKLKRYNKVSRGSKLIDYGHEKDHGFYNAHIQAVGVSHVYTGKITNPTCNFYYGSPSWNGPQNNVNSVLVNTKITEEELVKNWKEGSELNFTLEFRFTPSEELKSTVSNSDLNKIINHWAGFHLFTMTVCLSDWEDGLDEYNYEYTNSTIDIIELYDITRIVDIRLSKLMDKNIYGIFEDRQSANKFRRNLPKLIEPHKGKIMDLLSILSADTDNLEDILESFSKIRINSLYQDENVKGANLDKIWYKGSAL
jgi:hypothetical protein